MKVIRYNDDIFFAEENDVKMGYLTFEWLSQDSFAITHTVVEEAFRGRGVAKALVDAAVEFARENGYKIRPVCSYAEAVFKRGGYEDIQIEK